MGDLISSHEGGEVAQTLRGTLTRGLLTLRPQRTRRGAGIFDFAPHLRDALTRAYARMLKL